MPLHAACKMHRVLWFALATLAACASPPPAPRASAAQPAVVSAPPVGAGYTVVSAESLIIIRVYRGGTLSRVGHNHIVASHSLRGTVQVAPDVARSSCELSFAVAELTVDEAELRAAQGPDFAAEVPDSARAGTRHNMLGPALLNAEAYPQITMHCLGFESSGAQLIVHMQIRVRDHLAEVAVPVSYTSNAHELLAQGELALKQSDLGLTPFSAMLGALAVQDEMRLQFNIVARAP
jgi:hypothetical protein